MVESINLRSKMGENSSLGVMSITLIIIMIIITSMGKLVEGYYEFPMR
jgi:hypothetical protein